MIWSKARFQHSFELFPRVLKEVAPILLPLSVALWSLEFYVSWLNKARFDDPYSSSMTVMVLVGVSGVLLQCLISVFACLFIAKSTQKQMKNGVSDSTLAFVAKHFHQSLIESCRSFISIGLHTLMLVLPGIVRWIQMLFVTLITAFDPEYQAGKKDALEESARLVRGAWFPLLALLLFNMLFPTILEEMAKGAETPLSMTLVFYSISWLINLYFGIYFSLTFFARWSFKLEKR